MKAQACLICHFDNRSFVRMPNGLLVDCGMNPDGKNVARDVAAILNNPVHIYDPKLKENPDGR